MKKLVKIFLAVFACATILGVSACKDKEPEDSTVEYPLTYSYEDIHYSLSEDKTYYSVYGCNTSAIVGEIEILEAVYDLPVKSIDSSVFADCVGLTGVTMPNSVTNIGENAFYGCKQLEEVQFSSALETVGEYAFYGCENLMEIVLPDATKDVGAYSFVGCVSITELVVGDGVTSIGKQAFLGCEALMSVTLGKSLKKVDYYAFADCKSLTNVSFGGNMSDWAQIKFGGDKSNPLYYAKDFSVQGKTVREFSTAQGVTAIENWAFLGNKDLQNVTVGGGVQSIGQQAFYQCASLESVVIDRSVTTIGAQAFAQCSSLVSVYYTGVAAEWNLIKMPEKNNTFPKAATVYYYSETQPTRAGNWWHYDENGAIAIWEL